MFDFKDLSIFAASQTQVLEAEKRSFDHWAKGKTMEEHLACDEAISKQECALDGRTILWVLAPRIDPQTLDFLCSCQTYRRNARYYDGQLKTVTAYGVSAVFTPAEKRGRGYAKHMMRLLHWVIADDAFLPAFPEEWGTPPRRVAHAGGAYLSSLLSHVGEFYKSCGVRPSTEGWAVRGAISTVWDVESIASEVPNLNSVWKWLDEKAVRAAWSEDVPLIEKEIVELAQGNPGRPLVAYLPHEGVAEYQQNRALLVATSKPFLLQHWGIRAETDPLCYATWTIDVHSPSLKTILLTRMRAHSARQFAELMKELLAYAKRNQYQRVELWNIPEAFKAKAQATGGVTSAGDKLSPGLKCYANKNAEWIFNEP
ncbi:hypothetical protein K523DRAFT_420960 [Schizophyllum commune Tattone D]|nr:hypothetical protein K523DRAFT_420960 [Schizophyllum commune Tattone D]